MGNPWQPCCWAVAQMEQLDRMRISLASTLEDSNPDHAPFAGQETEVIDLLSRHPEITGLWEPATAARTAGRPFGNQAYPADKAFNFKPGDLRGMYAVYLPEVKEALAVNP